MLRLLRLLLLFTATSASISTAQSSYWANLAHEDLEAARALIVANHPGAVAQSNDRKFREDMERGFAEADLLANEARDFAGYRASIQRFAAAFDDGHITSNAMLLPRGYSWPGFLVALVDDEWRVLPHNGEAGLPTPGSRLVGCGSETPEDLAKRYLTPYVASWDLFAQRRLRSIRLFVDRNEVPFSKFDRCEFAASDGAARQFAMRWRPISPADYDSAASAARPPASRAVNLTKWGGNWWIRIGSLDQSAAELVRQVRSRAAEIQSSRFVVVDLRGNTGGASTYADSIAEVMVGSSALQKATRRRGSGDGYTTWRVSPAALATIKEYIGRFEDQPTLLAELKAQKIAMEEAMTSGESLSRPAGRSTPVSNAVTAVQAPRRRPNIILITDTSCFSSCLIAANLFRDLGATHVGQPTNANTNYSEVRNVILPSGLSSFSTLQAVISSMPRRIGPFVPTHQISDAVLADDEALRRAISAMVLEPERWLSRPERPKA